MATTTPVYEDYLADRAAWVRYERARQGKFEAPHATLGYWFRFRAGQTFHARSGEPLLAGRVPARADRRDREEMHARRHAR